FRGSRSSYSSTAERWFAKGAEHMDGNLRPLRRFVCLFALVFRASTTTASAQGQGNGILTGTGADNAGVVRGATITATDSATGLVRSSPSNAQSCSRLISLPPGQYSL